MLSKCNFSISDFLLVLGLHESRPNMENIFQLPVSPDRAAVILSSGRGDWADLQTHPVPALWCQMVQISRLILSIINSIFNLFSVSEYSISQLTNGIRGRCGTKSWDSWDSERRERDRERGTICITKRGEPEGEGDTRDVTWGQTPGTGHRAVVTSHQWSARARGAQGSGQWTPVRHMSRQGPVLVNGDTSGVRGALNGQHMSPDTGDWSVSPVHWSVRRSHWTQDFSNLRKLERNCDKTSCPALPGHTRRQRRG